MTNLTKNLLPNERILFRTKKHIIIFFVPIVLTIFSMYTTYYMRTNPILVHIQAVPWIVTLVLWLFYGLEYLTSEFAVTTKRILMREGFFNRHATEMRLASVSQINIDQGIVGQLLNFGTVSINAFGAYDFFPTIAQPFQFQKTVNEQLDKLSP